MKSFRFVVPFLRRTRWECFLLTFSDRFELFGIKFKNDAVAGLFPWSSWLVDDAEAWSIWSFRWNTHSMLFPFLRFEIVMNIVFTFFFL
jgi:hypothetical protein